MEQDDPAEALTELRERRLGALELLQAAAGSGLAAYAVWALLLQPGFRRVPLRLQPGALRWRERAAGGARVVAAARPPRKNGGFGLWRRQDRAGGPQVRPPPSRGLRAEPVAGGAGAAARLEGRLCRQRLLSPQGSLEGNLGSPGHPLTAQGAADTCQGWGPGLGSCRYPVPTRPVPRWGNSSSGR
uniref:protein N-lysine methyltransferase FAM173A isoform X7 n=1 Tax=Macaca mulatta TaxID=9544 RepID=UPI0010A233A0|nr:protein N-lysine methyltransferase FAM173A isoform X7 [Macaca mulatta]